MYGWNELNDILLQVLKCKMSEDERKRIIGKNLKMLRERAGLSQKQLCDIIEISPQRYNAYEKGKNEPSIEILVRLSHIYMVTVDYIVGRNIGIGNEIEDDLNNLAENDRFEEIMIALHDMQERIQRLEEEKKHGK